MLLFSPFFHLRKWVPLSFTCSNSVCSVSDSSYSLLCLSLHYWECMEHNSEWVLHPHILWHCAVVVVVICCCFLLPTSARESHSLTPAPMVYALSVIFAIDCRVYSPHYCECMEHNSEWVLHPHIFQWHCDEAVMCCCFLFPLTSVGESPCLPHAPMVRMWKSNVIILFCFGFVYLEKSICLNRWFFICLFNCLMAERRRNYCVDIDD